MVVILTQRDINLGQEETLLTQRVRIQLLTVTTPTLRA
jgi:hypothetical protein